MSFLIGSRDRAWPFSIFYEGDAEVFYRYAQSILAGVPYDNGIPFHPPMFPVLLAGFHAVLGSPVPHGALRVLLGIASAGLAPLVYSWARDRCGRTAALAAGLLTAFSFGMDIIGVSATSELLYLILMLLLLKVAAGPLQDPRKGSWPALIAGVLGGGLALTRAEGILPAAAILAVGATALARADRRLAVRRGVLSLLALCLAMAPWTIRNAVALRHWNQTTGERIGTRLPTFVPVTAYGPLNFALANNDLATGEFQRRILTSGSEAATLDLADPQHRHYFLHGTQEGARWIAAHPGRFLALTGRRLVLWSHAFDLGWTPWNLPLGRTGTRRPVDVFAPDAGGLRYAQLLLGAAGLLLLARRGSRWDALLLGAPIGGCLVAAGFFFGYVRLGVIASPFVFIAEGVAIAALVERLPPRFRKAWGGQKTAAALAVGALIVLVAGALQHRNYIASGSAETPGGKLVRDAPIHITPAR